MLIYKALLVGGLVTASLIGLDAMTCYFSHQYRVGSTTVCVYDCPDGSQVSGPERYGNCPFSLRIER